MHLFWRYMTDSLCNICLRFKKKKVWKWSNSSPQWWALSVKMTSLWSCLKVCAHFSQDSYFWRRVKDRVQSPKPNCALSACVIIITLIKLICICPNSWKQWQQISLQSPFSSCSVALSHIIDNTHFSCSTWSILA